MAHKYVLDTHALVWHVEGSRRLGLQARSVITDPASELVLPLIALAEAVDVVAKGRTRIASVSDLLLFVTSDPRLSLDPITLDVLQHTLGLMVLPDIHDRLIVAAALRLQTLGNTVTVLTKDSAIIAAGVVPTLW